MGGAGGAVRAETVRRRTVRQEAARRWRTARQDTARRWRSAGALLRATQPLPPPSRWMWAADAILAVVLAACTVGAALRQEAHTYVVPPVLVRVPGLTGDAPVAPPPPVPPPPPLHWSRELGPVDASQLVLAGLTALPLILRRRCPLVAFWAVIGTTLLFNQRLNAGDTTLYTFLSCVVAAYAAAVYSPYRLRALASLLAGAGLLAAFPDENLPAFTPSVAPFLVLLGVGLGANAVHVWKQRVRALQEQQETTTRLAVERERARIARELHDIVTHNVSVMVIQAGAARKVMDAAPDRAREALLAVEAGGRTAMAELRQVMGLLTLPGDDPAPSIAPGSSVGPGPSGDPHSSSAADPDLAPQPGLKQVPTLVDRVRATGVGVDLTVTGTPAPLPAGPDLAVYRVVQEALTNAVRHASGARVRVALTHTPGAVHVEVTDTGGSSSAPDGSGRGLIGLRERLALHNGTLQAGHRAAGGYRVYAVVPREGSAASGERGAFGEREVSGERGASGEPGASGDRGPFGGHEPSGPSGTSGRPGASEQTGASGQATGASGEGKASRRPGLGDDPGTSGHPEASGDCTERR
ncbi:histidine kinase [Streptomyces sp. NPDC052016]|uniref:histidine kinase n=1 Tax=Streptomyces sp. NPDC052016 TaxID=3365680 RepID=UPI0037D3627E